MTAGKPGDGEIPREVVAMEVSRRTALLAGAGIKGIFGSINPPIGAVPFGRHRVSRIIVGGNPVSGNSHLSPEASREMRDYFTGANVLKLLSDCEEAGINAWQSRGDSHILRLLNDHRLQGGSMHWIAQTASEMADIPRNIRMLAAAGAIGIYHHGSQTDKFWAAGKIEQARDMLKVMRDAGVQAGLGTHIPEVIDYVEDKGWEVDFYMTCLYNLSRTAEEAAKVAGRRVEGELFWEPDREAMLRRVRQTSKQCLIFKVYGAGRRCASSSDMAEALRQVAASAKPADGIVIGMFPKGSEQVRENCRLAAEAFASGTSSNRRIAS
ncbi:MAG: hypothetical protein KIT09_15200 [Bryobacteraceae bacterium]|nr:hypothetical protein [Bryobacteraceae bacterium]